MPVGVQLGELAQRTARNPVASRGDCTLQFIGLIECSHQAIFVAVFAWHLELSPGNQLRQRRSAGNRDGAAIRGLIEDLLRIVTECPEDRRMNVGRSYWT